MTDRPKDYRQAERRLLQRKLGRARFLRLVGAGVGLPFVPGSLAALGGRPSRAQTSAVPAILAEDGAYPIGIWLPPPPEETTLARYQEIADAGFNLIIGGHGIRDDETNEQALQHAAATGLKLVLFDQRLRTTIKESTATASTASTGSTQEEAPTSIMQHLIDKGRPRPASRAATSSIGSESTTSDLTVGEEVS